MICKIRRVPFHCPQLPVTLLTSLNDDRLADHKYAVLLLLLLIPSGLLCFFGVSCGSWWFLVLSGDSVSLVRACRNIMWSIC